MLGGGAVMQRTDHAREVTKILGMTLTDITALIMTDLLNDDPSW